MITVSHLTKTTAASGAVDDVTFAAQPGRVTGFLGPNGAGKSTTMRIMVGLTPPPPARPHPRPPLRRPSQPRPRGRRPPGRLGPARRSHRPRDPHPGPSHHAGPQGPGRRDARRRQPHCREAARRVRDYSLGMRQRLGIAAALLGDPEVLILDEPANGLDPAGIRWMRDLLRGYADQGGTVLLSSHLLHEIEVIADDLVVIGQGRIVAHGTKSELLEAAGTSSGPPTSPVCWPPSPRPATRPRSPRVRACAPRPPPTSWAPSPFPPASPCASSGPPTAPVSRRCSSP